MTILEALENAAEMLRGQGITGGDVMDDLELVIARLRQKYPAIAKEQL
jgi:hypothetical protein